MDKNYSIISELMMSISNAHNMFLDFIITSNTHEIMKGAFLYDSSKNDKVFF